MEGDFRIGEWLVQPLRDVIESAGESTALEPKAMDLLVYLAENQGEVLPKERLIQAIWPDAFVTDEVLTNTIWKLRQAFGDDPKNPKIIQTVPRRGYQLIAEVIFEEASDETSNRYELQRELGKGAMGEVHLAKDQLLGRQVALKFLPAQMEEDDSLRRRLFREARAAAALDQPYICKVYDTGQMEGRSFIAMEYVEGQTLKEKLHEGSLEIEEALRVATEIAEALQAAHDKSIVHRDIKPSNIMLTGQGHVKVMDFGVAKKLPTGEGDEDWTGTLTTDASSIGTLPYMSPEQLRGQAVDTRSDIFSFGVVLYEMLTGIHPFRRGTQVETSSAILNEQPPRLDRYSSNKSHLLQHTLEKMLAKSPGERYQTVHEIGTNLARVMERIKAPTPLVDPKKKGTGWLVGALGASVVVLLLAVAWLYLQAPTSDPPSKPLVAVPLTSLPGHEGHPSLSPDGKLVAFVEGHYTGGNIMVKQIGEPEGVPKPLTETGKDTGPVWSANGSRIFFLRSLGDWWFQICSVPALGGTPRQEWNKINMHLSPQFTGTPYLAPTPDGKSLVVAGRPEFGEGRGLYLLSLDTGEWRLLTEPHGDQEWDCSPCFSPDGRNLAFFRSPSEYGGYLCKLAFDEGIQPKGEPEQMFFNPGQFRGLTWSKDGADIVYSSGTWPAWWLWRINAKEPEFPLALQYAGTGARFPSISQNSDRLVYQRIAYDYNMYRLELNESGEPAGEPQMFQSSSKFDWQMVYSPDGSRVVFCSDRSGQQELFVCDRDGSNRLQLTSQDRWALSAKPKVGLIINSPCWSPDGKWIAFSAQPEGHEDIYLVAVGGGIPKRLTDTPSDDKGPQWSADSEWVYFRSEKGSERALWKVPVGGGVAIEADKSEVGWSADGWELGKSVDGKFTYYCSEEGDVWKQSEQDGKRIPIPGVVLRDEEPLVRDKVYSVVQDDSWSWFAIHVFDLKQGNAKELVRVESPYGDGFAVSPDGRSILYVQNDHVGSDIMLVDDFR